MGTGEGVCKAADVVEDGEVLLQPAQVSLLVGSFGGGRRLDDLHVLQQQLPDRLVLTGFNGQRRGR